MLRKSVNNKASLLLFITLLHAFCFVALMVFQLARRALIKFELFICPNGKKGKWEKIMRANEAKSTFANRISPEQMLFWFVFSLVYGVRFLCF